MPWSSAWLRPRHAHSTFILNTSYAIQTKYLLIARLLRTRHKFKYMRIFLNFEQFFFFVYCYDDALKMQQQISSDEQLKQTLS